jgi:hypothetical protein
MNRLLYVAVLLACVYVGGVLDAVRAVEGPLQFAASPLHVNAVFRGISRGAQQQAATFFASGGTWVVHPEPVRSFEMPILGRLPEMLNDVK